MPFVRTLSAVVLVGAALVGAGPLAAQTDVTGEEARDMMAAGALMVDVREYSEFCGMSGHVPNAASLPWNSGVLAARFDELPRDVDLIVHCASGFRSASAAAFLVSEGFTRIFDMGGIGNWPDPREDCGPEPVLLLRREGNATGIDWIPAEGTQDYDLVRGDGEAIIDAGGWIDLALSECLAEVTIWTWHTDAEPYASATYVYWVVRRTGGYFGTSSDGLDRASTATGCQ
jgi:rhodanese-related sulfurtransferase